MPFSQAGLASPSPPLDFAAPRTAGAVMITRGAETEHPGQGSGSLYSAMGLNAAKGPHSPQRYS